VAADEGVLHPLQKFHRLKKWRQNLKKKKIVKKKFENFRIIFKDFSPLQHPS
jgi:cell fate (sporulation/competence/biofilm development) regulator YlbF (YheA/YmcA/DUF963 family)